LSLSYIQRFNNLIVPISDIIQMPKELYIIIIDYVLVKAVNWPFEDCTDPEFKRRNFICKPDTKPNSTILQSDDKVAHTFVWFIAPETIKQSQVLHWKVRLLSNESSNSIGFGVTKRCAICRCKNCLKIDDPRLNAVMKVVERESTNKLTVVISTYDFTDKTLGRSVRNYSATDAAPWGFYEPCTFEFTANLMTNILRVVIRPLSEYRIVEKEFHIENLGEYRPICLLWPPVVVEFDSLNECGSIV
jgi:hypothetical protein